MVSKQSNTYTKPSILHPLQFQTAFEAYVWRNTRIAPNKSRNLCLCTYSYVLEAVWSYLRLTESGAPYVAPRAKSKSMPVDHVTLCQAYLDARRQGAAGPSDLEQLRTILYADQDKYPPADLADGYSWEKEKMALTKGKDKDKGRNAGGRGQSHLCDQRARMRSRSRTRRSRGRTRSRTRMRTRSRSRSQTRTRRT